MTAARGCYRSCMAPGSWLMTTNAMPTAIMAIHTDWRRRWARRLRRSLLLSYRGDQLIAGS
jgi:hypothetical protein